MYVMINVWWEFNQTACLFSVPEEEQRGAEWFLWRNWLGQICKWSTDLDHSYCKMNKMAFYLQRLTFLISVNPALHSHVTVNTVNIQSWLARVCFRTPLRWTMRATASDLTTIQREISFQTSQICPRLRFISVSLWRQCVSTTKRCVKRPSEPRWK